MQGGRAVLIGLDATLGTPGLPQSGTGHVALLTGLDAPRIFGRHAGPWVPTVLRPILREQSLLRRASRAPGDVAFANAYPEELFAGGEPSGPLIRTGPPLAALGAGAAMRQTPELRRGEAIASEIVNDGWRNRLGRNDLPTPTPAEAGRNLARLAAPHRLTLFAHYTTDIVGHRGGMSGAVAAIDRVDAFLGGVLESLPEDALLVVASDHGNLEDVSGGHTRNPALSLLYGPGADALAVRLRSLLDLTPALLDVLAGAEGRR